MFDTFVVWLKKIDWYRVKRTAIQVCGPVLVALALDFGLDGHAVVRDYVFGNEGLIVVGTIALATAMNIPHKTQ